MKNKMFLPLIMLFFFSLFIACEDKREDDMKDTDIVTEDNTPPTVDVDDDLWSEERNYTYADREQFEQDIEAAEDRLDKRIENLEEKSENATGDLKEKYDSQIENLKAKKENLDNKMKEFSNVTEDNWEAFKTDVNETWNDIETAWDDVDVELKDREM
jgi:hypothetical protein